MSESVKKRRKLERRSKWWQFFIDESENLKAICIIENCSEPNLIFKNNTTDLERHVKKLHKDQYEKIVDITAIDRTFSNYEKKEISKYTLLMIIMENRSFLMIHGEWYKLMMSKIQMNWEPTSNETLNNYLDEIYDEIALNVKNEKANILLSNIRWLEK
jgi:hypothetical protein